MPETLAGDDLDVSEVSVVVAELVDTVAGSCEVHLVVAAGIVEEAVGKNGARVADIEAVCPDRGAGEEFR